MGDDFNDKRRNLIAETTYYTRGHNEAMTYVDVMYDKERVSGTIYSGRSTSWTGKIAIPYTSDYGYAVDFSQCKRQLGSYDNAPCPSNNWMQNIITNNGTRPGWLLTPVSTNATGAWDVYSNGSVFYGGFRAYTSGSIVPVLALLSELDIMSGTGTSNSPYQLSVN